MRMTALRAGDVHLIERVPYEWVKQIVDHKIEGFKVAAAAYAAGRTLDFNVTSPPFDNKKLRQAVAHAIDRQEILHAAYYGFGEASGQKFPKGHAWYRERHLRLTISTRRGSSSRRRVTEGK